MRLENDRLHCFESVFASSSLDWRPVYVSPRSKPGECSLAECDDPSYNPWADECPNVKKRVHTRIRPEPEVQRLYRYKRPDDDLLWAVGVCLVKEDWLPKIEPEGFSGLEFHPVELFNDSRCRKPMSGYVEMRAAGRVAVDLEGSGIETEYLCPYCGFARYSTWKEEKGLRFVGEPDEWPDVFMPQQSVLLAMFVKPRFAQLMIDLKFRPFMLVRLEDMKPWKSI